MTIRARTILGALVPAGVLVVMNARTLWVFYHPQTCLDCGVRIGVPFAFWRSAGFGGEGGVLAMGLAGDIAMVALLAAGGGIAGRYVGSRHSS